MYITKQESREFEEGNLMRHKVRNHEAENVLRKTVVAVEYVL